jgi:PAS domain S-box-containing protein
MWKTILGGSVWCGEIVNRRKDGSLYCEEMTITPVLGGNGEVRNFVAIKQDVSQRKEFELALARERDLLRALMENAPDAIYFKDLNSRFLRCSATQAQQFGLKGPEDVVGKSDFDFFTEEHARPAFEDEQEIIRTGRPLVGKAEQEFWKADGKVTWALTTKMPLRNKAGEIIGTFGISKDITAFKEAERDRQSMEVQLRQAQKLEAIGQLAAGIAHEINTPIQFVGDNLRFLQIRFKDFQAALESYGRLLALASQGPLDPQELDAVAKTVAAAELDFLMTETPTSIAQALDGVERVADIVQAMKDFSHPDGDKQPADLGRAIESTSVICRNEWKHVADLKLDLDPKLPLVPCVVGDINQVILNLIVNAAHAIAEKQRTGKRGKGTITVSTQHRDGWCELRVADTGTGIPEALRGRIFDPFFTTKPVGKGTGQGLFLAHNVIAEKHQGTLAFETELGAGTTFIIRLPLDPRAGEPSNAA